MGKFEVLEYLMMLRLTGDDQYRRYGEVHSALRVRGIGLSYTSVWRSINTLYCDQLLDVIFETEGLQRTAKFRARISSTNTFAQKQRVQDTHLSTIGESPSATYRDDSSRAGPVLAQKHGGVARDG